MHTSLLPLWIASLKPFLRILDTNLSTLLCTCALPCGAVNWEWWLLLSTSTFVGMLRVGAHWQAKSGHSTAPKDMHFCGSRAPIKLAGAVQGITSGANLVQLAPVTVPVGGVEGAVVAITPKCIYIELPIVGITGHHDVVVTANS